MRQRTALLNAISLEADWPQTILATLNALPGGNRYRPK